MTKLRWIKTPEQVKQAAESNPEFLESHVRSIRIVYETDPALYQAVIPQPLEALERPEIAVTLSHVAMKITPEFTFEIGSAIFGPRVRYDGQEGVGLLTMPMTTEQAVVGGRETFGEPKKIAEIPFQREGDAAEASVTRMGIPYIQAKGKVGEALGPREFTEYGYCIKAFPSCEQGKDFDGDPLLVRLEWRHNQTAVHAFDGELTLNESPFDPVADLPVRRVVRMEWEEGTTESNGRVLRPLPAEWVLPFMHGRYDEPGHPGVEIG